MTSSVEKTTPSAARLAYDTLEPFHVVALSLIHI